MSKEQHLQEINKLDTNLMELILEFWIQYGHFGTWQYWITLVSLILPLIITFLLIDRKKIFQIAFFGYSFHMMIVYLDVFLSRFNYWDHPYHLIPYVPLSIAVDGALVPVTFMLAYQYAINHNKNFYLVTLITAIAVTSMAWVWTLLDLLQLDNGMNLLHIYLLDVVMATIAYWATNFFLRLHKKGSNHREE
jgi:hypothetical protein